MKKLFLIFLGVSVLLFPYAGIKTVWGATYLYKYLAYDFHSWGSIEYRSDIMDNLGNYHLERNPKYINIQMSLDEPVDGNSVYSITYRKIHARDDNTDIIGGRALAVYDNFKNSDGDIITKIDIIKSIIAAVIFSAYIIFIAVWLSAKKDKNKNIIGNYGPDVS